MSLYRVGLQLGCLFFTLLAFEVIAFDNLGGREDQAYYIIYMVLIIYSLRAKMNLRFSLQPLDSIF